MMKKRNLFEKDFLYFFFEWNFHPFDFKQLFVKIIKQLFDDLLHHAFFVRKMPVKSHFAHAGFLTDLLDADSLYAMLTEQIMSATFQFFFFGMTICAVLLHITMVFVCYDIRSYLPYT